MSYKLGIENYRQNRKLKFGEEFGYKEDIVVKDEL